MKLWILAAACAAALAGQVASEANRHYQTPEQREAMAKGLSRAGRDALQKPAELVAHMDLQPGMTVADIGTGSGYMLPHLSRAVGPSGRVLAEDVFDDFLARAREGARSAKLANVTFIQGTAKDPALPAGAVDVALALDSYHHYDYPREMLAGIRQALRPGGRLVVVEYYKRPGAMPGGNAVAHIRLDEPDVVREIEAAGFHLLSRWEQIPGSQYGLVFRKR